MSPSSALQAYEAALPYRHLIAGIGLDGDELNNPPSLFQEVFRRARADGWRVTAHCDFNQKNTHENIRYVVTELGGGGGTGAERIDHGMNAADEGGLMEGIREKGVGMTVCPCAYVRHTAEEEVFPRIRRLFDEGIKVTVGSDDPAYMEDNVSLIFLVWSVQKAFECLVGRKYLGTFFFRLNTLLTWQC